ncbi:CRTAC1 family protein [Arenibacterium halophilum]|uniref:CRTAC1 family protein n=1 Tax=Arenibacterium halophilum TaxID=2583821 RepID=A0ABY2X8Q3_9RHOB|nr:CRTAC1 family protein [Arenibacterium halophilum]TMV11550.1 CRTAC1 family protein [Arenibacterium halophilum]
MFATACAAGPEFIPVAMPGHTYEGGWEHYVGGGLAVFDCNGDALPELFAVGGSAPAALFLNRSDDTGITFVRGDAGPAEVTGATGAYTLDIDSDGLVDLVILRAGSNLILRGAPGCRFAPFDIGFDGLDRWTTAFSATWEGARQLPTLAFGNYVNRDDPQGPFRACDVNHLYRPDAARYGPPVALSPGYCALSMLFSDWKHGGATDLRISNDRHYYVDGGEEQLWRTAPVPRLFSAAEGWVTHRLWGMGIASRDLDGDGRQEVMMTSMGDQRLQTRDSADAPTFRDVPHAMGTTATVPYTGGDGRPSTGWHVAFGDVQNDGRDDILIVKGNVEQMPDSAWADPNNLLIQQPDGSFAEAGDVAGIASLHRGRGGALADLDGDGRLDIAVVNRRGPVEVWRNVTPATGHWIGIDLRQEGVNTRAVGAWIEVDTGARTILREVTVGGGHAGGSALPEHFGLGETGPLRVRVTWPGGEKGDWQAVAPDRVTLITRP